MDRRHAHYCLSGHDGRHISASDPFETTLVRPIGQVLRALFFIERGYFGFHRGVNDSAQNTVGEVDQLVRVRHNYSFFLCGSHHAGIPCIRKKCKLIRDVCAGAG